MSIDRLEVGERRLVGVGALIVPSNARRERFVAIRELTTNKFTHKVAGMLSIPMETCEPEELLLQTLGRLFSEEVKIGSLRFVDPKGTRNRQEIPKLCVCELIKGVSLHVYPYETDDPDSISPGTHQHEVNQPQWIDFSEVTDAPADSLKFRPGVFESVRAYFEYLKDSENFQTMHFTFNQLRHRIPPEVFKTAPNLDQLK